jgi:hypothetical protein
MHSSGIMVKGSDNLRASRSNFSDLTGKHVDGAYILTFDMPAGTKKLAHIFSQAD